MDESPKYRSVHFQPLYLIVFLMIFGLLIFLTYYLTSLSYQENRLYLNNIVVNTPTLFPPTLLPTIKNTEIPGDNMNKVMQNVILNADLYLNYLQEKEVENLYLLLTPDSRKLYSREDLVKAFTLFNVEITKISLKDSIAFSNPPNSTIEASLEAVLPLTINFVTKQGEKK